MKLVQTRISRTEYDLICRRVRAEGKTLEEWIRAAIRYKLSSDAVDPRDPIFAAFPLVRRRGSKTNVAQNHDEILYGPVRP